MFDRGISYEGDLLDLAVNVNVVEKSEAWFNYKTLRSARPRELQAVPLRQQGRGGRDPAGGPGGQA
jgi:recombination protein RecA